LTDLIVRYVGLESPTYPIPHPAIFVKLLETVALVGPGYVCEVGKQLARQLIQTVQEVAIPLVCVSKALKEGLGSLATYITGNLAGENAEPMSG
jgi:hypothetical protein